MQMLLYTHQSIVFWKGRAETFITYFHEKLLLILSYFFGLYTPTMIFEWIKLKTWWMIICLYYVQMRTC